MNYIAYPGVRGESLTQETIINIVCKVMGVQPWQVKVRSRDRPIAVTRQLIYYILRHQLGLTLKQIGQIYGYDHTTIIHSLQTIEDLRATDPTMNRNIEKILNQL